MCQSQRKGVSYKPLTSLRHIDSFHFSFFSSCGAHVSFKDRWMTVRLSSTILSNEIFSDTVGLSSTCIKICQRCSDGFGPCIYVSSIDSTLTYIGKTLKYLMRCIVNGTSTKYIQIMDPGSKFPLP